jgi:hypothetical protein
MEEFIGRKKYSGSLLRMTTIIWSMWLCSYIHTDSNYFAFSEDSIEKLIKPEMKEK